MAVTYTTALDRDTRRSSIAAAWLTAGELWLSAMSCIAVLALVLTYQGIRRELYPATNGQRPGALLDLNAAADAKQLEPSLEIVFANPADRRVAARALFEFLVSADGERRALPNVGAILRAEVPASRVDQTQRLVVYAERLRVARERAQAAGRAAPASLPVFTPADLAAIKSSFVVRTPAAFRQDLLIWGVLYLAGFHLVSLVWRLRNVRGDRVLLSTAHLLTLIGFAALLSRPDPLRDTLLFVRFAQGVLGGLVLMAAVSLVNVRTAPVRYLTYIPLVGVLLLSVLLIAFGHGPGSSTAKVNLGPVQPIEAMKLLLALFLAGYFARRWELLRQVRSETVRGLRVPAWLDVPHADYVLPVIIGVGSALALFFFQKDLGPALILACVFLCVYALARGRVVMPVVGFLLLAAGFYIGYRLHISDTLVERVRIWQSPWDNGARGGDQIAHAIWALAMGGPFGTGVGLGETRVLPAGHTDLILASIGEELGAAGLFVIAVAYGALACRGFRIARAASADYGFFLAMALTLFIVMPVLVIGGGILGLVPLTGIVTPFLSYGGSAMAANFTALGILAAIRSDPAPAADLAPFQTSVRWLGGVLAAGAAVLIAAVANVQLVHADEYLVKPHLGLQADGMRRYQYNPRVLDALRQIPRGTVYDRQGLPLATEDPAVALSAKAEYQKIGISIDAACPDPAARCYPLGGRAFHLLGDARTRLNWGASNTTFVERDAEDRLRGFDDHATAIQTTDASGNSAVTIRHDYRELLPLVRHRLEPDHPAVRAFVSRPRDVRLTVDARLQARVASIVASYAKKSASGKAAAVVLDADSGDLLASVSYPWPVLASSPGASASSATSQSTDQEALLDRPRFGLFPPGSAFKLVTAAAALRRDVALCHTTFECVRLPDGRVGAKPPGWARPVRDDVLDARPHGTIDMHAAVVVSCNAYFAQLAVRIGPQALLDAAADVDISVARSNAIARLRDSLPQAGYGQGEVVATPLRMARVAAAIAGGGVTRETRWEESASPSTRANVWLAPDAAQLLASYMRDVVLSGTGRSLKDHPWRIAGKTGTAEIAGAASHAWFVGFAPYGPATKRIAFAVLIENAGYGGTAAAPAAGEIVTAAASLGLVR